MNKLIFIGPLEDSPHATGGETIKNRLFLGRIRQFYDKVTIIDTTSWSRNIITLMRLLYVCLFARRTPIMLSVCTMSAFKFISLLHFFRNTSNVHYFVIASNIVNQVNAGNIGQAYFQRLRGVKSVLVETKLLYRQLKEQGLTNVMYLPNLKDIPEVRLFPKRDDGVTRFVFLSRIEHLKGVDVLFDAMEMLNAQHKDKYEVHFYGRVEPEYEQTFRQRLSNIGNAHYEGFLKMDAQGYGTLSRYDMMIFPSIHPSEGFPAIIIDAFVAALPLIASEGQYTDDLLPQGKAALNVPKGDTEALAREMLNVVNRKYNLAEMSGFCKQQARQFDIKEIISKQFLQSIGMIK